MQCFSEIPRAVRSFLKMAVFWIRVSASATPTRSLRSLFCKQLHFEERPAHKWELGKTLRVIIFISLCNLGSTNTNHSVSLSLCISSPHFLDHNCRSTHPQIFPPLTPSSDGLLNRQNSFRQHSISLLLQEQVVRILGRRSKMSLCKFIIRALPLRTFKKTFLFPSWKSASEPKTSPQILSVAALQSIR